MGWGAAGRGHQCGRRPGAGGTRTPTTGKNSSGRQRWVVEKPGVGIYPSPLWRANYERTSAPKWLETRCSKTLSSIVLFKIRLFTSEMWLPSGRSPCTRRRWEEHRDEPFFKRKNKWSYKQYLDKFVALKRHKTNKFRILLFGYIALIKQHFVAIVKFYIMIDFTWNACDSPAALSTWVRTRYTGTCKEKISVNQLEIKHI